MTTDMGTTLTMTLNGQTAVMTIIPTGDTDLSMTVIMNGQNPSAHTAEFDTEAHRDTAYARVVAGMISVGYRQVDEDQRIR